mmetsp:Transcript_12342/g.55703  ORF Transcript_12342/g.55703 Transcript_12342/m.55703 type:complete len:270 (-) Transcript_12342:103-912(-)
MDRGEGPVARYRPPMPGARGPSRGAREGFGGVPGVRAGAVRVPPPDDSRRRDPLLLHMAHQLDRDGHRRVRGAPRVGHAVRRATPRRRRLPRPERVSPRRFDAHPGRGARALGPQMHRPRRAAVHHGGVLGRVVAPVVRPGQPAQRRRARGVVRRHARRLCDAQQVHSGLLRGFDECLRIRRSLRLLQRGVHVRAGRHEPPRGRIHLPRHGLALTDARVGGVRSRRVRNRVAGVVARHGPTDTVEGFAVVPIRCEGWGQGRGRGRTNRR